MVRKMFIWITRRNTELIVMKKFLQLSKRSVSPREVENVLLSTIFLYDIHQWLLIMLENITTRATVLESLGVGENSTIELVGNTYDWNITELEYPRYLRGIGTFLCVLLLVVGLIGNTIVPIVVLYNRCLRNSTHFFLINLSVADLLVLLFCIPTALVELNSIPEVWTLGKFLCELFEISSFLEFINRFKPIMREFFGPN